MFARTLAVLTAATGIALGAAACSTAAAPQAAPAATAASSAPAPAPTATTAPIKVKPVTTKTSAKAPTCPADEATLLAAWERKAGHQAPAGTRLTKITCHDGWALAGFEPPGQESEVDSFRNVDGKWTSTGGGNAQYCSAIPLDVQKYFATHGPRQCDTTGL
ncbi:hypothetical protein [Actinoplanes sp. HUAS TT8]|uniref:hypothetical protein n=1 Tax=Actinoplanes sp. HUAS TT8 TaxID=3447453 RepID=UPI003F52415C